MIELAGPVLLLGALLSGYLFLIGSRRALRVLVAVLGLAVLLSFAGPLFERVFGHSELGAVVAVLGVVFLLALLGRRPRSGRDQKAKEQRPTSAKRRLERD